MVPRSLAFPLSNLSQGERMRSHLSTAARTVRNTVSTHLSVCGILFHLSPVALDEKEDVDLVTCRTREVRRSRRTPLRVRVEREHNDDDDMIRARLEHEDQLRWSADEGSASSSPQHSPGHGSRHHKEFDDLSISESELSPRSRARRRARLKVVEADESNGLSMDLSITKTRLISPSSGKGGQQDAQEHVLRGLGFIDDALRLLGRRV